MTEWLSLLLFLFCLQRGCVNLGTEFLPSTVLYRRVLKSHFVKQISLQVFQNTSLCFSNYLFLSRLLIIIIIICQMCLPSSSEVGFLQSEKQVIQKEYSFLSKTLLCSWTNNNKNQRKIKQVKKKNLEIPLWSMCVHWNNCALSNYILKLTQEGLIALTGWKKYYGQVYKCHGLSGKGWKFFIVPVWYDSFSLVSTRNMISPSSVWG